MTFILLKSLQQSDSEGYHHHASLATLANTYLRAKHLLQFVQGLCVHCYCLDSSSACCISDVSGCHLPFENQQCI